MANAFRMTRDGSLDREYLATCAVYRCIKRRGMGKERAIKILIQRWPNAGRTPSGKAAQAKAIVEIWIR